MASRDAATPLEIKLLDGPGAAPDQDPAVAGDGARNRLAAGPPGAYLWTMSKPDPVARPAAPPAPSAEPADPAKKPAQPDEKGGPAWPEPTRYGDWERNGRVSDF